MELDWNWGLLIGGAILILLEVGYGFWQFWTKSDMVLLWARPRDYYGRASGSYVCPNHFAGLLETVIPLLIARIALWNPSKKSMQRTVLQKVFIGYVVLMAVAALLLSFSRSSWIALSLALCSFIVWGEWQWRRLWRRLAAGHLG